MNARLPHPLDPSALQAHVDSAWAQRIVPELVRYIEVPAKSPMFDPDWAAHGLLERVLQSAADWVRAQPVEGLTWRSSPNDATACRRRCCSSRCRPARAKTARWPGLGRPCGCTATSTNNPIHWLAQRPRHLDAKIATQALRPRGA